MSEMPNEELPSRESMASLTLPGSLMVGISSPCTKVQIVHLNAQGTMYSGSDGDFDLVVLSKVTSGGTTNWQMTTWDYESGSGCRGQLSWRRNPAGDDPVGNYCRYVSGAVDCNAGSGGVWEVSESMMKSMKSAAAAAEE